VSKKIAVPSSRVKEVRQIVYLTKNTSDNLEAVMKWFEVHLLETDRGSSARVYVGDAARFCRWLQGHGGCFVEAGPLDLVQYRNYLQAEGKAPATINRALISLRLFYGLLKSRGEVTDNPVDEIKPITVAAQSAPKWLDRNQQAALVRAARGGQRRDEALIGVMLHVGLRVSEVCELERDRDVVFSERSGKIIVRRGKGNKYREVPLNKTIRGILSRWVQENPEGPLFPNRKSNKMTSRAVFNVVEKYAYLAKLSEVTPHTLRHTFCKNLIDMGVPIDQVAVMAGHSSLDVTKRYTSPSMKDLQAAVDRTAWE
jgi:integrase/recombinase XerC